jgi:transcriptional regulator of acetoin/glycerol metabolism
VLQVADSPNDAKSDAVAPAGLGPDGDSGLPPVRELSADAQHLINVLRRNQWCVTRTAREIGVNRVTVHRRMRRLGIVSPKYT